MTTAHKATAGTVPQRTNFEDGTTGHWLKGPAGENSHVVKIGNDHVLRCPLDFGPGISRRVLQQTFELSQGRSYTFSCKARGHDLHANADLTIRFEVQDNIGSEVEFVGNGGWGTYSYSFTAGRTGDHTLAIEAEYRHNHPNQFLDFDYIDVA